MIDGEILLQWEGEGRFLSHDSRNPGIGTLSIGRSPSPINTLKQTLSQHFCPTLLPQNDVFHILQQRLSIVLYNKLIMLAIWVQKLRLHVLLLFVLDHFLWRLYFCVIHFFSTLLNGCVHKSLNSVFMYLYEWDAWEQNK